MTKLKSFYPFFVMALLFLIGFLSYQSIDAYLTMRRLTNGIARVTALDAVTDLGVSALNEAFESARYYALNGVNYLERVQKSRRDVDRAAVALQKKLHECPMP
jgi:CHASE3 domain sensor protein